MITYNIEMTDTFGEEANYSWCRRAEIKLEDSDSDLKLVRRAKAAMEMTGVPCKREDCGDTIVLRPYGACVVCFITANY